MREGRTVRNAQQRLHLMYKPLPKFLTIKPSKINGLGIFATKDIKQDTYLGITHIQHEAFPQGWIRTPLGGFYNHSNRPNCALKDSTRMSIGIPTKALMTLKDISKGEELTCTYTLYSIDED